MCVCVCVWGGVSLSTRMWALKYKRITVKASIREGVCAWVGADEKWSLAVTNGIPNWLLCYWSGVNDTSPKSETWLCVWIINHRRDTCTAEPKTLEWFQSVVLESQILQSDGIAYMLLFSCILTWDGHKSWEVHRVSVCTYKWAFVWECMGTSGTNLSLPCMCVFLPDPLMSTTNALSVLGWWRLFR